MVPHSPFNYDKVIGFHTFIWAFHIFIWVDHHIWVHHRITDLVGILVVVAVDLGSVRVGVTGCGWSRGITTSRGR